MGTEGTEGSLKDKIPHVTMPQRLSDICKSTTVIICHIFISIIKIYLQYTAYTLN
jgi:hypothetical protein